MTLDEWPNAEVIKRIIACSSDVDWITFGDLDYGVRTQAWKEISHMTGFEAASQRVDDILRRHTPWWNARTAIVVLTFMPDCVYMLDYSIEEMKLLIALEVPAAVLLYRAVIMLKE